MKKILFQVGLSPNVKRQLPSSPSTSHVFFSANGENLSTEIHDQTDGHGAEEPWKLPNFFTVNEVQMDLQNIVSQDNPLGTLTHEICYYSSHGKKGNEDDVQ